MKWKKAACVLTTLLLVFVVIGCGSAKAEKDSPSTGQPQVSTEGQNSEPQGPGTELQSAAGKEQATEGAREIPGPDGKQPDNGQIEVTLYFGDNQAMYLKPETRMINNDGRPMAELLVQELIKGPQDKNLWKTIPPEAKLLSLEINNGIAYVNFSPEMKTKHWGGTTGETMTVQSIVQTLTQLPEIKQVQFLINGQKEYSIWGHGDTRQPIGPDKGIVAK